MKLFAAAVITGVVLAASPARAGHDQVYSPCDSSIGYVYLSVEEVHARVVALVPDGLDHESITITEAG